MSAYILVNASIKNHHKFKEYTKVVPGLVKKYGGRYLVLGSEPQYLEGKRVKSNVPPYKVVMHQWPSVEQAKAFWYSDEYQLAKKLRENTGDFEIILIDGIQEEILD